MFMSARLIDAAATSTAISDAISAVANSTRRVSRTTNAISDRVTAAVKRMLGKVPSSYQKCRSRPAAISAATAQAARGCSSMRRSSRAALARSRDSLGVREGRPTV
jgi:hypothetical protein